VVIVPQTTQSALAPVTQHAVEAMKQQRALLADFVKSQLVEANFDDAKSANFGEGDYGIIPGTKKRCLLKSGAEKMQKIFQLGCRFKLVDKEIDKAANFAMFTYKSEIYSLATGTVIAECDASTNSQEIKYKERTVWRKNENGVSVSSKEETPIFDVMNTLQKMAQKRAMIGATILATGASEYFTQDMIDPDDAPGVTPPATGLPTGNATSTEPNTAPALEAETAPQCCGKDMMVSKYADKETGPVPPWYCTKCKSKKTRS